VLENNQSDMQGVLREGVRSERRKPELEPAVSTIRDVNSDVEVAVLDRVLWPIAEVTRSPKLVMRYSARLFLVLFMLRCQSSITHSSPSSGPVMSRILCTMSY
jgi:hypothetical protein